MEITDVLSVLLRWLHIGAGILWIGLLYFFNWVNGPFQGTMDGDTKKKVNPELLPRALYWFRWGAAYTFFAGLLLLYFVYWSTNIMFVDGATSWNGGAIIMVLFIFIAPFIYDALAKSALGKNPKVFVGVMFVLVLAVLSCFVHLGNFSYRAYNIHLGAMFGTIMVGNVWMRIWPAQKKVIPAIKEGTAPDAALVAQVGQRGRHNTYLSVPLVWTMINAHTVVPGADSWLILPLVVLLGWGAVTLIYGKSTKVKGF